VTNLQGELAEFGASLAEINLWETIESKLSPNRTHTSLSVGDEIEIDGRAYVCKDLGFQLSSNLQNNSFLKLTVSQVAPILPYLFLVLILIFRPKGLLGTREG
jgi:hypothetical protein